jgi:hypothetical protein
MMADEMVRERPGMPEGYGVEKGEGAAQVAWAEVEAQLAASRNYWLCTTRRDGRPHAMPVWGLWMDGAVCFDTDRASQKGRNIALNPAAVVHLESGDDVVVLEGVIEESRDAGLLQRFDDAYEAKYGVRPGSTAALVLRPRRVLAWRERDFPQSATRWRRKS